jgi:uncharacterized membrane protein YhaH (DUF805 family)
VDWYFGPLKKYTEFSGRASRKEYWLFTLGQFVIGLLLALIIPVLYFVFLIGTLLPVLAVWVRRLHDTNRSGWWCFIVLVPLVGNIMMLVFLCSKGTEGDNDYGPNPLLASAVSSPTVGLGPLAGASEPTDQAESPFPSSDSTSSQSAASPLSPPPAASRPVIKMRRPDEPESPS